jgi:hypothetical protein
MKTAQLSGVALDWAVAKCEGFSFENETYIHVLHDDGKCLYSTDWAQGGLIIEREEINISKTSDGWQAWPNIGISDEFIYIADTPLEAAMRCYVASKLGNDIEIPLELLETV